MFSSRIKVEESKGTESLQRVMGEVIPFIKFGKMSAEFLDETVEPLNIVPKDILFVAYKKKAGVHLNKKKKN